MVIPIKQLEKALLRKGFRLKEGDHKFLYFYFEGKVTSIRTKLSRGSSHFEYGDELLGMIRRQLMLDTKDQLLGFINCPFKEEDYIQLLKRKGLL